MSNRRYDLPSAPSSHILNAQSELEFVYTPMESAAEGESLRARLLYVTSAKYEGDWHSITHAHSFSELFFITGGRGQFLVNGHYCQVRENDLIIINPHVEHTELSLASMPLEYIVLGIEGMRFEGKNAAQSGDEIRISCSTGRVRQYMGLLLEEVQWKEPEHASICQNLLNIILICILGNRQVGVSPAAAGYISPECEAVKNYMDSHFQEPITLEALAEAAHQNKFYVAHAFRESFGVSPIRYLTERRVEESKNLLRTTNYPIGEVSAMSGFSSISVFSQTFKRVTHMSPSQYRAQAKDGGEETGRRES